MENSRQKLVYELRYNQQEIYAKREEIARRLQQSSQNIKESIINKISNTDLQLLFELYDQLFLCNWFKTYYKGKIKFSLSKRMTKSAGLTLCPKNIARIQEENLVIEIRMGVDLYFRYDSIEGLKEACGVKTDSSLTALQVVFEHELCHAIEFICLHRSSCKGKPYKALASNIFGHSQSYHCLPTEGQIAKEKLGLSIGDTVSFEIEGEVLTGIINNINKRVTVMVRDNKGDYKDSKGNRYSKYYVPMNLLNRGRLSDFS